MIAGRMAPALNVLIVSVPTVNFIFGAVLPPLEGLAVGGGGSMAVHPSEIAHSRGHGHLTAVGHKHAHSRKHNTHKSKSKSKKIAAIGKSASSGGTDSGLSPWNLLAVSLHSLLMACTSGLRYDAYTCVHACN